MLIPIIIIIALAIALKIFLPEIFSVKPVRPVYSYKRRDFLMSRPEHEFFDILVSALENQYYVFPQVHLPNILDHKIVGQNWKGAFRHMDEKSVDFVICDKAYIKPLLVIELDDKTHEREDRVIRDEEVERILTQAELPFLRFGNKGYFNKEEIKELILGSLKKEKLIGFDEIRGKL
jgi:very-short-patch-repair endonuclease